MQKPVAAALLAFLSRKDLPVLCSAAGGQSGWSSRQPGFPGFSRFAKPFGDCGCYCTLSDVRNMDIGSPAIGPTLSLFLMAVPCQCTYSDMLRRLVVAGVLCSGAAEDGTS